MASFVNAVLFIKINKINHVHVQRVAWHFYSVYKFCKKLGSENEIWLTVNVAYDVLKRAVIPSPHPPFRFDQFTDTLHFL